MERKYVSLRPKVRLTKGCCNSLLVNFENNDMYSINSDGAQLLFRCLSGLSIEDASKADSIDIDDAVEFIETLEVSGFAELTVSRTQFGTIGTQVDYPLDFIWIELTSRCNLRCVHCYAEAGAAEGTSTHDSEMSTKELEKLLDDASNMGCKQLQFTGGECTLRSDLTHLICYAREVGYTFIEVFTNGVNVNRELIEFFRKLDVCVAISVYSHNDITHDKITGVDGSFLKTMGALKLLLAYGVKTRTALIAMKQNESDLDAATYFFGKLGVQHRSPDHIRPSGRGRQFENWPKHFEAMCIQESPRFVVDQIMYERAYHHNSCWSGKLAVSFIGDVMPCVFARDLVSGNIRSRGLKDIVDNEMMSYWQLSRDKVNVCWECEYRYLCCDCRPLAYGLDPEGDLYAKSPRCTYDPHKGRWGSKEQYLANCMVNRETG